MKRTIGIADMRVSKEWGDELVTHALGSCLGVTIHDVKAGVGGMIHLQLPTAKIDQDKARKNPYMFVDTGIPMLFKKAYEMGAQKENIVLKVSGGAKILDAEGHFNIGQRNYTMLRKLLWKNSVPINSEDVGGAVSRTMSLDVGKGVVTVRFDGKTKEL